MRLATAYVWVTVVFGPRQEPLGPRCFKPRRTELDHWLRYGETLAPYVRAAGWRTGAEISRHVG